MRRVGDTWLEGWVFALLMHGALFAWLLLAPPRRVEAPRRPPTRVHLAASTPRAAPEPRPAPAAEPERARRVLRAKAADAVPSPAPTPTATAAPPLAPSATPPPVPAPLRRFAVSMEATVPGGGVAVPVAAPGAAPALRAVPGGTSDAPDAPVTAPEVETPPRLVSQPPVEEVRALYPDAARRDGVEADVHLEILVTETGEVADVRIVRSGSGPFDEVARRLVRRFRFRPGERGGRPVPVRISWTFKFRLED